MRKNAINHGNREKIEQKNATERKELRREEKVKKKREKAEIRKLT